MSETLPPLGGRAPVAEPPVQRRRTREYALAFILLVAALVAGWASLLPWRDVGARYGMGRTETGWVTVNGSMGRGWIPLLLAVGIAVGGVLIAGSRQRVGAIVASLSGAGLALLAVLEWGLGIGAVRWGPGAGLWIELLTGTVVVLAVGVLSDPKDENSR